MKMAVGILGVLLATLSWTQASEELDLGKVELHVIASGDTINFFDPKKQDIIECHLAGVEAPPPVKRGSNVQDFAKMAREWLANRLKPVFGQKSELRIRDLGDVDNVRQVILYMGDSSVSINEQLIALGLAIHQETGTAGYSDFDDRLEKAERQALMFRKGIWDVAKQETNEVVINIAQGKKLRRDEAFYTYIGAHERSVYEVRCIFRDIRNDKLYFTESATGRNAQSPSFQNEVEIPVFDRLGVWDYREYGKDNDRPKRFRFGVMNTHVWLCSVGETKRQTRVVKPGDPNIAEKNPAGDKNSFQ